MESNHTPVLFQLSHDKILDETRLKPRMDTVWSAGTTRRLPVGLPHVAGLSQLLATVQQSTCCPWKCCWKLWQEIVSEPWVQIILSNSLTVKVLQKHKHTNVLWWQWTLVKYELCLVPACCQRKATGNNNNNNNNRQTGFSSTYETCCLISIWAEESVQRKLDDSYRNREIYDSSSSSFRQTRHSLVHCCPRRLEMTRHLVFANGNDVRVYLHTERGEIRTQVVARDACGDAC